MALINITGYRGALHDAGAVTQVPLLPAVGSQQVDTTSDGTSTAIPAAAVIVKVASDSAVYMTCLRAAGTATAAHELIPANVPHYFAISPNDGGWYLEFTAV